MTPADLEIRLLAAAQQTVAFAAQFVTDALPASYLYIILSRERMAGLAK